MCGQYMCKWEFMKNYIAGLFTKQKKDVILELVSDNYHSDNKNHIWFYRLDITKVINTKVKKRRRNSYKYKN